MTLHLPHHTLVDHQLSVPLDHDDPDGDQIPLFAREVVAEGGADRPFLVFLQGGPGGEATRPDLDPLGPAWIERAARDFRVLLLDQRGTGRSGHLGVLAAMDPAAQARHLTHFRADAIVRDCEILREHVGVGQWSVLGQSFGGFCAFTYLSLAPGSLAAVYLTGGIPPIGAGPEVVYPQTYPTMAARSRAYFERFPEDRKRMLRLLDLASDGRLLLPDGEPVTPARLRSIGTVLGMSYGGARIHHLLERDPESPAFRYDLAGSFAFSGRELQYSLLQEACYADGGTTDWAAQRLLPEEFEEDPTLFFGEHVFPASFADDRALEPYAEAADLLAGHVWPRLYDPAVLTRNTVPGAAAVYADDAYVDRELGLATLREVPGIEAWVTPDHQHDGLRTSGAVVLDRLFEMVRPS